MFNIAVERVDCSLELSAVDGGLGTNLIFEDCLSSHLGLSFPLF